MKYQRFSPSGYKDIGVRKSKFVTKTKFLCKKLFKCADCRILQIFQILSHIFYKMILNSKVIVNVITIKCFFNRKKRVWTMKNTFLLLNNVISILDLFKILTYYIEDKKILKN